MTKQLQVMALLGVLALSPLMAVGCGGVECGPNTKEKDGKCVPTYDEVTCADGTTLNPDTGACVLTHPPVDCAAGTELQDGSCVVVAAACGDSAQLDANSGKCVPTATVCGDGLAFTDGKCMPTDQVCDSGTTFSADTGMCLPEATCKAGDFILNGNCVSAAENLAANADVTSTENDDPTKGGTANTLTLTDGEQTVFTGQVDAPSDLDSDGAVDQDVDVFSFDATAGQVFTITIQPIDATAMGFMVTDEGGQWVRYSDVGYGVGSARKVLIPSDGTYYVAVAPASFLLSDGNFAATGKDGWKYVGTIEQANPLSATDLDTSAGDVTGDLVDITDNLFKLTNYTEGAAVHIDVTSLGGDGSAALEVWTSATDRLQTMPLDEGQVPNIALPAGDVFFFVDWTRVWGPDTSFDLAVSALPGDYLGAVAADGSVSSTDATLAGDADMQLSVSAEPGQFLEFTQHNDADSSVKITVSAPDGTTLIDGSTLSGSDSDYEYAFAATGGPYTITVSNPSSDDSANFVLTVNSITPTDEGDVGNGDSVSVDESSNLAAGRQMFYRFNLTEDADLTGALTATIGDVDGRLYDGTTGEVLDTFGAVGDESVNETLSQGVYVISPKADNELSDGFSISLDVIGVAVPETEGNDTMADAQILPGLPAHISGNSDDHGADPDYFGFTLTDSEVVSVTMDNWGGGNHCGTAQLYDADGNLIASDGASNAYVGAVLEPGNYYVAVTGTCTYVTNPFSYDLVLNASPDPADTLDSANDDTASATDATGGTTIAGTVTSDADVDWYRVQVATDTDVALELSELDNFGSPNSGLTVEIYDDGQTLLGGAGDVVSFDAATDYYVKVTGYDSTGDGNSYLLTMIPVVCGDGMLSGAEACEDGNTADGDGCSATCTLEGSSIDIAASGSSVWYTGMLASNSPTYERLNSDCLPTFYGAVPYQTFEIVNNTGSGQTLTITASWDGFDGSMHAYHDPFNPTIPMANCIDGDADYGGVGGSQLTGVSIAAGETLVVVAETFYGYPSTGAYSMEVATE